MTKRKANLEEAVIPTLGLLENPGLLLVSGTQEKANVMTIGWGFLGNIWSIPVFIIAVRPSRYTYRFIESTGDFTVNVPAKNMDKIVSACGTFSGRSVDKFKEFKLTPVKSEYVKSPTIKECPINFECKVIYKQDLVPERIEKNIIDNYYSGGNFHRLYFGKILNIVVDEDYKEKLP